MTVISLAGVRRLEGTAEAPTVVQQTSVGPIGLTVFRDFQSAAGVWSELQANGICVHAQTLDRAKAWFQNVSAPRGSEPVLVAGRAQDGAIRFVWPFELSKPRGLKCLRWIGWEHANYQMGVNSLEFSRKATPDDMKLLLQQVANMSGANAALLENQPVEWDGVRNPMALLPHFPSANMGHAVLLDHDFETLYRNRFSGKFRNTLRRKEKRLQEEGHVEMGWAGAVEERLTLLETFFTQEAARFFKQDIVDVFSDANIRAFYRELCTPNALRDGVFEISFLKLDGAAIAISCGIFFRDKFTTLLTSTDSGSTHRLLPGAILTKFQIEECCKRGLNFFDMGASDACHRSDWCDVQTALFDTAISFDERGYLLTLPQTALATGKRFIKSRPKLWALAQKVRPGIYGKAPVAGDVL